MSAATTPARPASLLRRAALGLGALSALLAAPAGALIVPMTGWAPVNGNANDWADASGACLLREERTGQAFPVLDSPEKAKAFALRLQTSLAKGGVREVVTQPVDRAGEWGVLAAYAYEQDGVVYRISQLYLGDSGLLRTVTGSSAEHEASPCVNEMREFLRYLAD